jgi:hypothetical protein
MVPIITRPCGFCAARAQRPYASGRDDDGAAPGGVSHRHGGGSGKGAARRSGCGENRDRTIPPADPHHRTQPQRQRTYQKNRADTDYCVDGVPAECRRAREVITESEKRPCDWRSLRRRRVTTSRGVDELRSILQPDHVASAARRQRLTRARELSLKWRARYLGELMENGGRQKAAAAASGVSYATV